jgi:hypothetical protein
MKRCVKGSSDARGWHAANVRRKNLGDLARRNVFAGVALDADDLPAVFSLNQLG